MSGIGESYICECCGGGFTKTVSDEAALAEAESLFPAEDLTDMGIVCDPCFCEIMAWAAVNAPEMLRGQPRWACCSRGRAQGWPTPSPWTPFRDAIPHVPRCRVYWGSHGCDHPRGHEGPHECDCCECGDRHPDPDAEALCVAKPPYYGPDTRFYGEEAEALGLPAPDY